MNIGQIILTAALTCLASLTVTLAFNSLINGTKKSRENQKQEEQRQIRQIVKEELEDVITDNKLEKKGLQVLLKNDLRIRYDEWMKKGYAPQDAKDDLERMYQVYHSLGANGVMDIHRSKFLNLPNDKPVKIKKQ